METRRDNRIHQVHSLVRHLWGGSVLAIIFAALSPGAMAYDLPDELCPAESWSPKVNFNLEGASYKETLAWLSGWSYALTAVGQAEAKSENPQFCLPECKTIMAEPLLNFLNSSFADQNISSEQAAEALWVGVLAMYKCQHK